MTSAALTESVLGVIQHLFPSPDVDFTFARVTQTAVQVVDACDYASITVNHDGQLETRAPTHDIALAADQMQYDEGEGPCMDAVSREQWVLTPDVTRDRRWPRFSARLAAELNVHAMLSCRLSVTGSANRNLGGLNLYATRRDAFTDEQRDLGLLLAAVASVAAEAGRTKAELTEAIKTRQTIGEAIGIIRVQSNLTSEQAFSALSSASQRMNVKLRELAARIAANPGTDVLAAGYQQDAGG